MNNNTKYIVQYNSNCEIKQFYFTKAEKAEAIATAKNLALRYRGVELFHVYRYDPEQDQELIASNGGSKIELIPMKF